MKARDQRRTDGDDERTDQGDELEQSGHDAKEESVRDSDRQESDGAEHADEKTRKQRCAHVRRQRVVDVLEQLGAASAKRPAWKRQQDGAAERFAVLQEKKRDDGNQDEPRKVGQQREQSAEADSQI